MTSTPEITIDPEFSALIPPQTVDEVQGLEVSLLTEGCQDALTVWGGLLLDGHLRYKLCKKNGIPFEVREAAGIEDRDAAKRWIILHQFARRNLTTFQRAELAIKLKPLMIAIATNAKKCAAKARQDGIRQLEKETAILKYNSDPGVVVERHEKESRLRELCGAECNAHNKESARVYFIACGNKIKIGCSSDPEGRLKSLLQGFPDAKMIGAISGGRESERALHETFSADHVKGEWFHRTPEMMKEIQELIGVSKIGKPTSAPYHVHKEAEKVSGVSHETIARAEYLYEHADEETKGKLRSGDIKISKAYDDLKAKQAAASGKPAPKPRKITCACGHVWTPACPKCKRPYSR